MNFIWIVTASNSVLKSWSGLNTRPWLWFTLSKYDSLGGIKRGQCVNSEWKHLHIFLFGLQSLFHEVKSRRTTLGCQLKQVYPNSAKGRWINSAWGLEKCSKLLFPSNRNLRLMYSLLNVMQTNLKNTDRALCNGNTWREMTVLRKRAKARGFDK